MRTRVRRTRVRRTRVRRTRVRRTRVRRTRVRREKYKAAGTLRSRSRQDVTKVDKLLSEMICN